MAMHRTSFTHDEIEILKELFRLKDATTEKNEQKKIRDVMRSKLGFYISDFDSSLDYYGFCRLVDRRIIKVLDDKNELVKPAAPAQAEVTAPLHCYSDDGTYSDIENELLNGENFLMAGLIPEVAIPKKPGLYCIRIADINSLPDGYREAMFERGHDILYIGQASKNLFERCWEQELHHKSAATFFRKVGAMLGYRPSKGSLAGHSNQNNFKFKPTDTDNIISWIETNLLVNMVVCSSKVLDSVEQELIERHKPLLNGSHNPARLSLLERDMQECRRIARGE